MCACVLVNCYCPKDKNGIYVLFCTDANCTRMLQLAVRPFSSHDVRSRVLFRDKKLLSFNSCLLLLSLRFHITHNRNYAQTCEWHDIDSEKYRVFSRVLRIVEITHRIMNWVTEDLIKIYNLCYKHILMYSICISYNTEVT